MPAEATIPQVSVDPGRVAGVIRGLTETRRAECDDGAIVEIDPFAVPNQAADLLERASEAVGAETMVEVGIASALSTLSICQGCLRTGPMAAGSFDVMDPWQQYSTNIGLHAIERAGRPGSSPFTGRNHRWSYRDCRRPAFASGSPSSMVCISSTT